MLASTGVRSPDLYPSKPGYEYEHRHSYLPLLLLLAIKAVDVRRHTRASQSSYRLATTYSRASISC
eukprot:scaffold313277_cov17-Prasinocladus_malaysianus.AAC.2